MLKIRRSHDRLILTWESSYLRETAFILRRGPCGQSWASIVKVRWSAKGKGWMVWCTDIYDNTVYMIIGCQDDVIKWKYFHVTVTDEFPSQRRVTRSFDVFFDLRLGKQLNNRDAGDLEWDGHRRAPIEGIRGSECEGGSAGWQRYLTIESTCLLVCYCLWMRWPQVSTYRGDKRQWVWRWFGWVAEISDDRVYMFTGLLLFVNEMATGEHLSRG